MSRKPQIKYKKAPQAPRRFKSSYMFFSTEKHKSIRRELEEKGEENSKLSTTDVAKMVSQAWKDLSNEEREVWEELARKDKARYEMEKSMYSGPWKVPAKRRTQKDPSAPKRPMSAFLSFSNAKRSEVKDNNPDMGNAEISRVLAQMWKDASDDDKKEHINNEFRLRQEYKVAIADWRKTSELAIQEVRKAREDQAMKAVLEGRPVPTNQADCQDDDCYKPKPSSPSSIPAAGGYPPAYNPLQSMAYGHAHPMIPQRAASPYYYGYDGHGGQNYFDHHIAGSSGTAGCGHSNHKLVPNSSWSNGTTTTTSAGGFPERSQYFVGDYSVTSNGFGFNEGCAPYSTDPSSWVESSGGQAHYHSSGSYYGQHSHQQHYPTPPQPQQYHEPNGFDPSSIITKSYDTATNTSQQYYDSRTLVNDVAGRGEFAT